jgi:DNA (cytosine-5)-methyltransferase 1
LDEFRPRVLLIENVDGLLSAALRHRPLTARGKSASPLSEDEMKGSFLRWLLSELTARDFSTSWAVVEAADYGAPQLRQRSIIIGVRSRRPIFVPDRRFGGPGQPAYRTVRQALQDVKDLGAVQPLSERKRAIYAQIPAGGNWRNLTPEIQAASMGAAHIAAGGKSGWWRRLSWEQPSPTILGMPDHSSTALIHPDELRCLSVNECAALQTFDPHTEFAGSSRSQYQQIGNAVPVVLAEAMGRQILNELGSSGRARTPEEPLWRQLSANRRIGTHGWAVPRPDGKVGYYLRVKVREDHVWTRTETKDIVTERE